ncbi:MAG: Hsp70 family protein, partial [Planctomycetaceae bacterium]|nr:Hsp70 family protein [Planctomycetaceae bacterium]
MPPRSTTHAVGIDLGTTYSCLSILTPHGQPQTLPNTEGELSTPSVVFFEGDDAIVGTEALRNSVTCPERVVMHAKRHMGDPQKNWVIDGRVYTPVDVSAFIVRKLLDGAEQQLGVPIKRAVITVPAQFSEIQRQCTVDAGKLAGLEQVDVINEPVAAALCHVLSDGMWFAEIANDQTVLVFDLGGGTFDLSLVKYNQNEVRVQASGGDLHLGGLDWNKALETFVCDQFSRETGQDPRLDRESMQSLSIEVEQVKRALSVRDKASLMVQHAGRRKTYAVDRERFETLTKKHVTATENITKGMLKANRLGWQNVDAVLVTGGASRMPMVKSMLDRISGTTLNTMLSPDQSISHGAAYYAGMLMSGQSLETSSLNREARAKLARVTQQSVNARGLGILVRDMETGNRVGHYLIPANTPLPAAYRQRFGTVVPNQKRVSLHIVESGTGEPDQPVELGTCVVDELPANLPIGTPIEVTIRYDAQARVHVEAKELGSGKSARTTIVRRENVAAQSVSEVTAPEEGWASLEEAPQVANATSKTVPQKPIAPAPAAKSKSVFV